MKFVFSALVTVLSFLIIQSAGAVGLNDPVREIPAGTIFRLTGELEIPANSDYLIVGQSLLDHTLNSVEQVMNDPQRQFYRRYGYCRQFNQFASWLFESCDETYRRCLEQYRITCRNRGGNYHNNGGRGHGNNMIVQQGRGNVAIINNPGGGQNCNPTSYIPPNPCAKPEYTISALLINQDALPAGGILRQDYEFTVIGVYSGRKAGLNRIDIEFDHEIIESLTILTTHPLSSIYIGQLVNSYSKKSKGFWESMAQGIAGVSAIAGQTFAISFPQPRYID